MIPNRVNPNRVTSRHMIVKSKTANFKNSKREKLHTREPYKTTGRFLKRNSTVQKRMR